MISNHPVLTGFAWLLAAQVATSVHTTQDVFSSNYTNGSVAVGAFADGAFDGVYIPQINSTSYEWWYFDATANDLSQHLVFQPYVGVGGPSGLSSAAVNETAFLLISGSNQDSSFELLVPTEQLFVSTVNEGSQGISAGNNFSWIGSSDLSTYDIAFDLPEHGVQGKAHFVSIAPAHGPYSEAAFGADLTIRENLLWANAIPDSVVQVEATFNGSSLAFTGYGYHDKNWGGNSFFIGLNQWYWGHAHVGDYSVVWFYVLSQSNVTTPLAYIAKDGDILFVSQPGKDLVTVRPYDSNGTVYPVGSAADRNNLVGVTVDIDAGDLGVFNFTTTSTRVVTSNAAYQRWIGSAKGGLNGEMSHGTALWEEMGPVSH